MAQLAIFLGIEERNIGQIGGGKRKPNGQLDVAMIQSLVRIFEKRLVTYRAIGYAPDCVALKFEEPREERTVEYDEDADRNARGPEALAGLE